MNASRVRVGILSKIICLVKFEMQMSNSNESEAYAKLISTEFYKLLKDKGTALFLEPIEYVEEAYTLERTKSKEEMLKFIQIL